MKCCERDTDEDGNCPIHSSVGVLRHAPAQGADEPGTDDEPFCRDCADENGTCPHDGHRCGSPAVPQGAAAEPTREEADDQLVADVASANLRFGCAEDGSADELKCHDEAIAAEDALKFRLAALRQSLASAEARETKLREALEFYADAEGHKRRHFTSGFGLSAISADQGARARAALSPSPSEPGDTDVPS